MKTTLWTLALASLVTVGTAMLAAQRQNRPGDISEAHFFIDNRGEQQAVPVKILQPPDDRPLRAEVTSAVTLAPSTVVAARVARTAWEYRTVTVPSGSDPNQLVGLLGPLGQDGWEVTGSELTRPDGVVLILKRARETAIASFAR